VDVEQKLALLTAETELDRSDSHEGAPTLPLPCEGEPAESGVPVGKSGRLFKVLQSNECVHDCHFCPWRSGRDRPRATLTSEELAGSFAQAYRAGLGDGLYLSSGIRDSGVESMDRLLQTADLLRERHGFDGYLHLKVLPGAQRAQVQEAMRLANRVSLNLEAPTPERLGVLTRTKDFEQDLLEPLAWIRELSAEFLLRSGVTTQFVVGPAGETDAELIRTAGRLYGEYGVRRVFYSAFQPVMDTPLENHPATPGVREARLIQADLLMRSYGMGAEELSFTDEGRLPTTVDPKMAHALNHPERFPVEVNSATYEELIRVPGIGPLSAKRLLSRRRERLIRDPREIALCGAILKRAAPFVLLNGRAIGHLEQFVRLELRKLNTRPSVQLPLFATEGEYEH
jgi:predicted DNA-binding helix-hairpin-helix protein